jgi:hypothetical protein
LRLLSLQRTIHQFSRYLPKPVEGPHILALQQKD